MTLRAAIFFACLAFWIVLIVTLSGCARPVVKVPSVINETSIYQMGNAYGVVQAAAITYASLPVCPETRICRTREATAKLAELDRTFVSAYGGLQAFIRAPTTKDGLSVIELYAIASGALNSMAVIARPVP